MIRTMSPTEAATWLLHAAFAFDGDARDVGLDLAFVALHEPTSLRERVRIHRRRIRRRWRDRDARRLLVFGRLIARDLEAKHG